jgi:hypothetical protein
MHLGSIRLGRFFGREDTRQLPIRHPDLAQSGLGRLARLSEDGRDGVPDVADLVFRDGRLISNDDSRLILSGDVAGGEHEGNVGQGLGLGRSDAEDLGMRVRRPQDPPVQHSLALQVVTK